MTIKWGVIGTGRIADWVCSDIKAAVPEAQIVCVGSRSRSAAEIFAKRFGINAAYDSYRAVYEDPAVEAVYIATPHTLHLQNASDALQAGKAVLCEKPLTINSAECRQLIDVAQKTDAYLMEAMWTYFLPAIRKARQWVDEGRIGRLKRVKSDFGYPVPYSPTRREFDATLGGGCLLEMGIYPVAIAHLFANRPVTDMKAFGRFAPNGVESDVTAILNYGDCVAELGVSFESRLPNAAHIVGDKGYITIPDAFRAHDCHLHVLDDRTESFYAPRNTRGYECQVQAVCRDLRAKRHQSPIVPWQTSLAIQELIDRIRALI